MIWERERERERESKESIESSHFYDEDDDDDDNISFVQLFFDQLCERANNFALINQPNKDISVLFSRVNSFFFHDYLTANLADAFILIKLAAV